jgi:LmbE family N-acetylglucosaminyl deacetylase
MRIGVAQAIRHRLHHQLRRNVALVVAAEGGHDADPRHLDAILLMRRGLLAHRLQVLGMAAVEILDREGVGGRQRDRAADGQLVGEGERPVQPGLIEPESGIMDARLRPEARHHRLGIGPAWD